MADVQKIATREAYGKALVELGKEHDDLLVFDADLAEATRSGKYGEEYPDRFVDCGIAEANMIGMAAGVRLRATRSLQPRLLCSRLVVRLSRSETRWVTLTSTLRLALPTEASR